MSLSKKTKILVQNITGREIEMTIDDYERLTANGLKLHLICHIYEPSKLKKIRFYTAIFGDYPIKPRNDIVCFSQDNHILEEFMLPREDTSTMRAKQYKLLPHLLFKGYDATIWMDGNIYPKISEIEYCDRYLGKGDMAVFKHPFRETVYEEFEELMKDPRFTVDKELQRQLKLQRKTYEDEGLPADMPLWECNFLIRRDNPNIVKLNDKWWGEVNKWQRRDQVSYPYVVWRYGKGLDIRTIIDEGIRTNKLFKYRDMYAKKK